MITTIPELLAPAGDAERLEMALHYGADAVYLAGKQFGLRASAGNFDSDGMRKAVSAAHAKGAKVYVTVNVLPHEHQLSTLPAFLEDTADTGVDGFIIADLGVLALAKRHAPNVPIHISTQLGVVNSETAKMLYDLGAKRVVLAREMSMENIRSFRNNIPKDLEIEAFVHGAMCVSFSGRCLLSNYITHRDANGGACSQPCRWKYHLVEEKRPNDYFEISEDGGTFIMNSSDMCMIEHIGELVDAGVSSFKIEGRMKSSYYAAVTTNAYRHAIDDYVAGKSFDKTWLDECMKVSHRRYSTGFYFGEPGQYYADAHYFTDADVCGIVESCGEDGEAKIIQRNKFCVGDRVELVTKDNLPIAFTVTDLRNAEDERIESAPHPMMELHMHLPVKCDRLSLLRKLR
ncbi:MAG: U32 family peptidase [Oscillospiraceae bacterium]|nr:U32 family peptidase [Oscillospiraceae bacterium]